MKLLVCHSIGFFFGFILDLWIGDPYFIPHPVRWIGGLIAFLERMLLNGKKGKILTEKERKARGFVLAALTPAITAGAVILLLYLAYSAHMLVLLAAETVMTYQILALKGLRDESMKVYRALQEEDTEKARKAVSMIVGRDTQSLDKSGIIKAAVETVAENTCDGVIAPLLYLAAGGPAAGFFYKAVNTMDSMVGYKNEKYRSFGYAAAKLDDILNYLPARISALLLLAAAFLSGREYNGKEAYRIFIRDRYCHASPNSAQTEAVCAGALGLRLSGDAYYFGKKVPKPFIGDAQREPEDKDIKRVNRLLYRSAFLGMGICLTSLAVFALILKSVIT